MAIDMKKNILILFSIIFFTPCILNAAGLQEITKSIQNICQAPTTGTSSYYKIVAKGNTSLKVRFLGKLGGEAEFTKEEWEGVQRVLRKDLAGDRKDYRLCVRTLTPTFIIKFTQNVTTLEKKIKFSGKLNRNQKKFLTKYPQFDGLFGIAGCTNYGTIIVKSGKSRYFNLKYNNNSDMNVYINSKIITFYDSEGRLLDLTLKGNDKKILDPGGKYGWTEELKNSGYTIPPHTSMKIIETGRTKDGQDYWKWVIKAKPLNSTTSLKNYSFVIQYITVYDLTNTPNKREDDLAEVSCAYYKVI